MKNQRNIDQKSTKNQSWRPLRASWKGLAHLEGMLGASWGRLGGLLGRLGGLLGASRYPTWLQVEPQKDIKIDQKSKQKSINFSTPLGIRFLQDFKGFWEQNGGKLVSKIEPKTMLSWKGDFLKKHCFSNGKNHDFEGSGVEVGSKNRSTIDQKSMLTCEGILASIFHRFWWILEAKLDPSWHPKPNKNGYKKPSKKEAPKKASWNP